MADEVKTDNKIENTGTTYTGQTESSNLHVISDEQFDSDKVLNYFSGIIDKNLRLVRVSSDCY